MRAMDSDFQLKIPLWGEGYVALQRTQYQHPIARVVRKLFRRLPYDRYLLRYVERLRNRPLSALYTADIRSEYTSIQPALPSHAANILDIGCGMAGIDVFLFEHYDRLTRLYLMDKTRLDRIYYGFEAEASFYNDKQLTKKFLMLNGVPESAFHFVEAVPGNIERLGMQFDLVISLIAWGFHFPLTTYLDEVLKSLRKGGRIIIDLRIESDGEATLRSRNLPYECILEHEKYRRVCIAP